MAVQGWPSGTEAQKVFCNLQTFSTKDKRLERQTPRLSVGLANLNIPVSSNQNPTTARMATGRKGIVAMPIIDLRCH